MSLELIEKFILEISPARAKTPVHSVFVGMRADPIQTFVGGFNLIVDDIKNEGSLESAAAVNGLLTGVALCYGVQRSTHLQAILEDYLKKQELSRGENIVDFMSRLAERKR